MWSLWLRDCAVTLVVGVTDEEVQVVGWWVGGASEVDVAHTADHRNSTVDVAATSGSEYFSLLGSGSSLWVVSSW